MTNIGHNNPPSEVENLLAVVEKAEKQAAKVTISNDDEMGKAGTLVKVIRENMKVFEDHKKAEKQPLQEALDKIQDKYATLLGRLQKAIDGITEKMKPYMEQKQKEQDELRKKQEEERRLAEEKAAAAEAAGKVPDPAPRRQKAIPKKAAVTSSYGHTVSMRDNWTWEMLDETELPIEYFCVDIKKINQAVKKGVREIPGVRIYNKSTPVVR